MNLIKEQRLEDYKITQLFPIDIFESDRRKTLAIDLYLFKIGRFFPLEEIGNFKILQKQYEKELCSYMLFGCESNKLPQEKYVELKKILNKRASSPTRESPYIKFFIKSIIKTILPDTKFATYEEELNDGWCFSIENKRFDLTLNKNKFPRENLFYINSSLIIGKQGMIQRDAVLKVVDLLPLNLYCEKLNLINEIINSQREKLALLYNYQEENQVISIDSKKAMDLKR